jgi:uncharacterized protein YjaZ
MLKEQAELVAAEARTKAESIFGVSDVQVVVEENPDAVIPETGAGGYTPDSHTVFVYIDPNNHNLQNNLEAEVRSTVTHEFHHAVRNRTINWKTDTLLGALVTEGLADHFDLEMNGGKPRPWSLALTGQDLSELKRLAEPEYENRTYDHAAWFFGSEERGIPRWGGYALGFKLVSDYLVKTGKKASELVSAPSADFK